MKVRDWLKLSPLFLKCIGKLPADHLFYLAKQFRNENPHHHNGKMYINTFFPPYPSEAFNRFMETVLNRKRLPYSTYFAVTDKCPFTCPHCSYGRHKRGQLDTADALKVIEQIKSLGTITVGITGGEPLLRDDIVQLTAALGDNVGSIIFTTGYGLTKQLANQLVEAGLNCMMIGIESDDAAEHDKIRGLSGSFDQTIQAIEKSLGAGLYTAISTVGTKQKIASGQILRLAEFAKKNGVHEFRVLEPIPTGSFSDQPDEILSHDHSKQLAEFHKQWNRKNQGPAISAFSYLESEEMFGCGAGFHHLYIDALGNVCPCDLTPLSFGNVLDEPLENIWQKMEQLFDLPGSKCLMKEICSQTDGLMDCKQLPLDPQTSSDLCRNLARTDQLPKVYQKLFKRRKPANRPSNLL